MRALALMIVAILGASQPAFHRDCPRHGVSHRHNRSNHRRPGPTWIAPLAMSTRTNKDGHFAFNGLAPGQYRIRAQQDGYFPAPQAGSTIDVSSNTRANTVTLFLTPAGAITGRILDPLGRPSPAALVTAARLNYLEGRPTLTPVKTTTSNDRGDYRLFWLEPGEYFVLAEKSLPSGASRASSPGTDDRHSALKVAVVEGAESSKTDFALRNVPGVVSVSGVVTSPIPGFENPPLQFYLSAIDSDGIDESPIAVANALTSSQDRASGKFELRDVSGPAPTSCIPWFRIEAIHPKGCTSLMQRLTWALRISLASR